MSELNIGLSAVNDEDFLKAARQFLDDHAALQSGQVYGHGDDGLSNYRAVDEATERARLDRAKAWKAVEFDAGFGWITGPTELGGSGRTAELERGYLELRAGYDVPSLGAFAISLGMVAPTFLAFGGEAVRRLVPLLWRGDLIGCQLFSEPTNGSDVAGLITRATRHGDDWVINGQKVWTSGAHHA